MTVRGYDPYRFDGVIPDYFLHLDDDLFDGDSPVDVRTLQTLSKNHNYLIAKRHPRQLYTQSFGGQVWGGEAPGTGIGNAARFYGLDPTSIPNTIGTDIMSIDCVVHSTSNVLRWSLLGVLGNEDASLVGWVRDTAGRVYSGAEVSMTAQSVNYANITQYDVDIPLRSIGMQLPQRGGRRVTVGISMVKAQIGSAIGATYTVASSDSNWVDVGTATIFGNSFLDIGNTEARPAAIMRVDGNRLYTRSRMQVQPVPGNSLRIHLCSEFFCKGIGLWERPMSDFYAAVDVL